MFRLLADKNRIVADYLDILPANPEVVVTAEQSAALRFAPDNDGNKLSAAGVNFHVRNTAQAAAGFGADDLFIPKFRY